ncbi:hypothetical protein AB0E56_01435 [Microbacterium sp. NPDC028030]|uniref:hypothetical protein n=1 Tax=Microbacterium sp. NPDC028030 TaxID=3155124 RepID=UPI0033C5235F
MTRKTPSACIALAFILALSGCAAQPALSERDAAALAQLDAIAGPTSGVAAEATTGTECWLPSAHALEEGVDSDTAWRVLCRVHYTSPTGDRYQDTTCIGDFASDPMLDHCYRWTHYDFAEVFEDHPGVSTG